MIVILGPTASGKTSLAAHVAFELDGEVISADSRQVYKGMDIGTGKDLADYIVNNKKIPCHLIDIAEPGYEYNVFEFKQGFLKAFRNITDRNKLPVLCGGTGLYIEAVLRDYSFLPVKEDPEFADTLRGKSRKELIEMLKRLRPLHNTTDILDEKRLIKALQIAMVSQHSSNAAFSPPLFAREGDRGGEFINFQIFGIRFERETLRKRITERLESRLKNGLIEEVRKLSDLGLSPDQLKFYGLEYRYVTMCIRNELTFDEMLRRLNIAIRQYAKRQMTWFRKMERSGFTIHWIDGEIPMEEKINTVKKILAAGEKV